MLFLKVKFHFSLFYQIHETLAEKRQNTHTKTTPHVSVEWRLTVELKRRWQMLQEIICFFLRG